MAIRSPVINVMTSAALKAARGLIRDFGEVEKLQVSVKGPSDFVSSADLRAERTLKSELRRARPGYGQLFEESGAEKGAGAFLNDRRLRVSARRQLGEALIATGLPFRGRPKHPSYTATLVRVIEATSGVRRFGSAALDLAY